MGVYEMSEALRGLDRKAGDSLRSDRARLSRCLLSVFVDHLPMEAWNESDEAMKDALERWRINVGERAGQELPKAEPLASFQREGA